MNIEQYMLAIKRDNKDYLPLEWNVLENYNGENLSTLEGIDEYTSKLDKIDLIAHIINENIIDYDEKFRKFVIIYNEKGKMREVKEGPIFIDKALYLDFNRLIDYIADNISNKDMINQIYNICITKGDNKNAIEFIYVLKNINLFKEKGTNAIKAALLRFNNLDYNLKRSISYIINERFIKDYETDKILKKEVA